MERLMCPRCAEVEEEYVPAERTHHVEYTCAYVLCGAFLQADVKMRVEGTNRAAVSFGVSPNPCTCDRRLESALTPQAALPEAHIAALQKHKRMP